MIRLEQVFSDQFKGVIPEEVVLNYKSSDKWSNKHIRLIRKNRVDADL